MSTGNGKPPSPEKILEAIEKSSPPTKLDQSAGILEERLQREIDDRRGERFHWIIACTILLDLATFPHLTWIGIICIFLLEVLALIGMARRQGVDWAVVLLETLYHHVYKLMDREK